MNRKKRSRNALVLQLLGAEFEDNEASSSKEEDNIILQTVLIQRLNTRYLKFRIYHVAKSKDWWQNTLPLYDPIRFKKLLRMFSHYFQQLADLIRPHS
ncbi:16411_t:CDS:1, partial [Funneliformis caledonium]